MTDDELINKWVDEECFAFTPDMKFDAALSKKLTASVIKAYGDRCRREERDLCRRLLSESLTQMQAINGGEDRCVHGDPANCRNHALMRELKEILSDPDGEKK